MVASASESLWSSLFYLYLAIALVVGAGVIGWLLTSMVKFRWRPGAARPRDAPQPGALPAERGHVLWVYVMAAGIAAIMFGLAFSTISAIDTIEHPPEGEPALHVNVSGSTFSWTFIRYDESGFPIKDVASFTVPVGTNVVMNVTSTDVWHNFAIPNFRVRVDAIPGETNHLWFKATQTGDDHAVCVMLCGAEHQTMRADVHVVSKDEYAAWLKQEAQAKLRGFETIHALRHLTVRASGLEIDNGTIVRATIESRGAYAPSLGGVALNVTNADAAAHSIRAGSATLVVPPGETRVLWVPTETGPLDVASDAGRLTLSVVAPS